MALVSVIWRQPIQKLICSQDQRYNKKKLENFNVFTDFKNVYPLRGIEIYSTSMIINHTQPTLRRIRNPTTHLRWSVLLKAVN